MELIDAGDKEIQKIFSQYESDKNVYQLIDTLKTVDISEVLTYSTAINILSRDEGETFKLSGNNQNKLDDESSDEKDVNNDGNQEVVFTF